MKKKGLKGWGIILANGRLYSEFYRTKSAALDFLEHGERVVRVELRVSQ